MSNCVKCPTSRLIVQANMPDEHAPPEYTLVIMALPVSAQPLDSLTTKLFAFILDRIFANTSGRCIVSVAFFPRNPVPGLNQICPCCIPIEFGNSPERKFCVPVSERSSPVKNVILPNSSEPDNLAKYNQVKLETFPLVTRLKLLLIPWLASDVPIAVYIDCHISVGPAAL